MEEKNEGEENWEIPAYQRRGLNNLEIRLNSAQLELELD